MRRRGAEGAARTATRGCAFALSLVAVAAFARPAPAGAQIAFDDVTASAGVAHTGYSFGSSWGDFDGDGRPDLWTSNHFTPASLYRNRGDGSFENATAAVLIDTSPQADKHGAEWADFDNDGDQDLYQMVGAVVGTGTGPKRLWVNGGGLLTDQATQYGLAYPLGRGRTPLWFDYDRDGKLDVLLANLARPDGLSPTALFAQRGGHFDDVSQSVGLGASGNAFFAQMTGRRPSDPPLLLIQTLAYPQRALRYDTQPFQDVKASLGLAQGPTATKDVAIADLNGDLRPDLFVARHEERSELRQMSPSSARASLVVSSSEQGFELNADGDLTVEIGAAWRIALANVFIGASGQHPSSHRFVLAAADASTQGWAPHVPGVDTGVYIGRDPATGVWRMFLSNPSWIWLDFDVSSAASLSGLVPIGFSSSDGALSPALLVRGTSGFSDATVQAGLATPVACDSVAAGDLDDDMDVDLFLACTSTAANLPDVLLENQGNGTFVAVPQAGGAEGTDVGRGDTVTVADYDEDGFLDLLVTNGEDQSLWSPTGGNQLFHNRGNANHWIEIDLEGVVSNRDGIGARVLVSAGGKTQLREQNGGMHRFSQDHARIHVGLGSRTVVDEVRVEWPNGAFQRVTALPADQVVRLVEPSAPSFDGRPSYQPGVDAGVYLWREPSDGSFHVRASGDGTAPTFTVSLVAVGPVQILGAPGLEAGDVISGTPNGFALTAHVASDEDGVDFRLPSGSIALVATARDGRPNPRNLHVGASGAPLSPSGWIGDQAALPALPPFQVGQDLGLFIGRTGNTVVARWSGDGAQHRAFLALFSSLPLLGSTPVGLEADDGLASSPFLAVVSGKVAADADGIDVQMRPGSRFGLSYQQDGLFQSHRVNPLTRELGPPNASFVIAP